jgi:hypothetical protein
MSTRYVYRDIDVEREEYIEIVVPDRWCGLPYYVCELRCEVSPLVFGSIVERYIFERVVLEKLWR